MPPTQVLNFRSSLSRLCLSPINKTATEGRKQATKERLKSQGGCRMKSARKQANIYHWLGILLLSVFVSESVAQDLTIFDSRRPVSLTSKQTTYRDFYINGGIEHGVKRGMILTVTRRLTLYDTYRANSPKEIMVEVGRVKIIHAQKGLSVARHYGTFSRANKAVLENDFIMVGDKVDMSSALMESQLKKKKSSASRTPKNRSQKKTMASSSVDFAKAGVKSEQKASPSPVPMKSLQ